MLPLEKYRSDVYRFGIIWITTLSEALSELFPGADDVQAPVEIFVAPPAESWVSSCGCVVVPNVHSVQRTLQVFPCSASCDRWNRSLNWEQKRSSSARFSRHLTETFNVFKVLRYAGQIGPVYLCVRLLLMCLPFQVPLQGLRFLHESYTSHCRGRIKVCALKKTLISYSAVLFCVLTCAAQCCKSKKQNLFMFFKDSVFLQKMHTLYSIEASQGTIQRVVSMISQKSAKSAPGSGPGMCAICTSVTLWKRC